MIARYARRFLSIKPILAKDPPIAISKLDERGAVLVFVTLLIVLLLIMVGLGLDTGHLVYIRAQGQAAVDAAALSAASAIPTGSIDQVNARVAAFNSKNDYVGSRNNPIKPEDVTLVRYSPEDGNITTSGVTVANANGVRVGWKRRIHTRERRWGPQSFRRCF